jgi:hypothetical protein
MAERRVEVELSSVHRRVISFDDRRLYETETYFAGHAGGRGRAIGHGRFGLRRTSGPV